MTVSRNIILILFLLPLLLIIWAGWVMVQRNQAEELWGYYPMILFLAITALGYGTIIPRIAKRFGKNILFLPLLTGALLSFGFPPIPIFPLLFVGFIPLLIAEHTVSKSHGVSVKYVGTLAYFAFLVWNVITTFWVANTAFIAGLLANFINPLLMTIPFLAYHLVKNRMGGWATLAGFACSWIAFEFLHMRWDLYWPWLTLGNGMAMVPSLVQWYEYTGVFGGSLWILVTNFLLFRYFVQDRWKITRNLVMPAGLFVLLTIISVWHLPEIMKGPEINVAVVQPNLEPHYEKFRVPQGEQLKTFLQLAETVVDSSTHFLVFPETSFSNIDLDQLEHYPVYQGLRSFQQRYPNLSIITGISGFRRLSDQKDIVLPTTRTISSTNGPVYLEVYNAALHLAPGKNEFYYKELFVPGAEFFPFRNTLFFLKPVIDALGGSVEGYRTLERFNVFTRNKVEVAPVICYESIFGEFITNFVQKGANVIFILTNDGWWDNTAGHRQHMHFARLRAIETRRSIARAANMGNCAFISPHGHILLENKYGEQTALQETISLHHNITFYVKWGDIIGRLSIFISGILLLRSIVVSVIRKR